MSLYYIINCIDARLRMYKLMLHALINCIVDFPWLITSAQLTRYMYLRRLIDVHAFLMHSLWIPLCNTLAVPWVRPRSIWSIRRSGRSGRNKSRRNIIIAPGATILRLLWPESRSILYLICKCNKNNNYNSLPIFNDDWRLSINVKDERYLNIVRNLILSLFSLRCLISPGTWSDRHERRAKK